MLADNRNNSSRVGGYISPTTRTLRTPYSFTALSSPATPGRAEARVCLSVCVRLCVVCLFVGQHAAPDVGVSGVASAACRGDICLAGAL